MNVRIVYRNYKPPHDLYRSLWIEPPPQVTFTMARPLPFVRRMYPLYRAFGDRPSVRRLIALGQDALLRREAGTHSADLVNFLQVVPGKIPDTPYVIDFEHAAALVNFVRMDERGRGRVLDFLTNSRCRGILPLTAAARESLLRLFPEIDEPVRQNIDVIYPALPAYGGEAAHAGPRGGLRLLFVGNDVYRKGLHELLAAFDVLSKRFPDLGLTVVSDAPQSLKRMHHHPGIRYCGPVFSFDQMIKRLYLSCDAFVLPTHCDTFGMAILCALACGKPVVTTGQFACRELVRHGENGWIVRSDRLLLEETCMPDRSATRSFVSQAVDPLLVEDLVETLGPLNENRDLLKRMSREAVADFKEGGKFSVGERNRKLAEVYRQCLTTTG